VLEETRVDTGDLAVYTTQLIERSSAWHMLKLVVFENTKRHYDDISG
jgi:hypothetical protein